MTAEIFEERIFNLVGNEYTIIKGYTEQTSKLILKHNICGTVQEYKPSAFLDGQRCKQCMKLEKTWNEWFKLISEYKEEFGTANIPKREKYHDKALGIWVQRQRNERIDGKLSKYQIDKLDSLEIDWNPLETEWERRYMQYQRYVLINDTPYISRRTDFEGEHLGAWVETQRKWLLTGKMSDERIEKMKKIDVGFGT